MYLAQYCSISCVDITFAYEIRSNPSSTSWFHSSCAGRRSGRLQQLMEVGGDAGSGEWAGIGADTQGKAWVINTSTGKMKTCWYGKSDGNWTVLCGWED